MFKLRQKILIMSLKLIKNILKSPFYVIYIYVKRIPEIWLLQSCHTWTLAGHFTVQRNVTAL